MYQPSNQSFTRSERNAVSALGLTGLAAPAETGLIAGTMVETDRGWKPVEAVLSGMQVQCYGGLRRVARVERSFIEPANPVTHPDGLLLVPGGALNNCSALYLLPSQLLLLETIFAEQIFGDAATLLPAAALDGFRGIMPVRPRGMVEVITLRLDTADVVWANTGVLFHCPGITEAAIAPDFYLTLSRAQAEALLALIGDGALFSDECAAPARRAA